MACRGHTAAKWPRPGEGGSCRAQGPGFESDAPAPAPEVLPWSSSSLAERAPSGSRAEGSRAEGSLGAASVSHSPWAELWAAVTTCQPHRPPPPAPAPTSPAWQLHGDRSCASSGHWKQSCSCWAALGLERCANPLRGVWHEMRGKGELGRKSPGLWAWPLAPVPPRDQVQVLQEMHGLWSFRGREVVIRGRCCL